MGQWFAENWLNLSTALAIMGSWWSSIFALRKQTKAMESDAKSRRVANQIALTANYCEIKKVFLRYPELLSRVTDPTADVAKQPVTPAEEAYVNMVMSQTNSVYEALKDDLLTKQDGARRDVKDFFTLPIPKAVWQKAKPLQNHDFVAFIDSSLK
jgi:hypothetical protein